MSDPICPVHQKPMRFGKGVWYCTAKVGEGWCKERIRPGTQATPQAPSLPQAGSSPPLQWQVPGGTQIPLPAAPSFTLPLKDDALAIACLEFAGKFAGQQNQHAEGVTLFSPEELLAVARDAYITFSNKIP